MSDPTILPRRALERQGRMHQWLQDVPGLTASEHMLATWLINRGDGYGDTVKAYKTIAAEGGATSPRTAERAVRGLAAKGLLDIERRVGKTGPTSNRLRLRVPAELFELKLSEADMRAGADPYDADLSFRPKGTARLAGRMNTQPADMAGRIDKQPARLAGRDDPAPVEGASTPRNPAEQAVRQYGDAKMADEPSYLREEEKENLDSPRGSSAKLAGRHLPFAGKGAGRSPRSAADVFAPRPAS